MNGNEKKNEGLCLYCARQLGIPQVDEYMKQMGITDDDLEALTEAMSEDGDSFEMGGTGAMPNFISNLLGKLGGNQDQQNNAQNGALPQNSNRKKDKDSGAEKRKGAQIFRDLLHQSHPARRRGKAR